MTHKAPQVIHSPDLPKQSKVRKHPDTGSLPRLLTTAEAAEFLAVSETLVYRLVERRELAVHRVGRCLRFSRDDLTSFLASRRTGATSHS